MLGFVLGGPARKRPEGRNFQVVLARLFGPDDLFRLALGLGLLRAGLAGDLLHHRDLYHRSAR